MELKKAIENHRKMWNWIADETEKQKRAVDKWEYYFAMKIFSKNIPFENCYCCEYTIINQRDSCNNCIVKWTDGGCMKTENSEYRKWVNAKFRGDYKQAAKLARIIANLPERECNL